MKGNEPPLLREFQKLLDTPELPALGPEPRTGRMDLKPLEGRIDALAKEGDLSTETEKLVRSLILLWHDHLDESHTISQDLHTTDGSFLHGIMHRREPDYWNSKYWFSRVGHHPSFPEIGKRTETFLQSTNATSLQKTLLMDGDWNPIGFIDAVEQAMKGLDQKQIEILQRLQEIESRVLLERFLQ